MHDGNEASVQDDFLGHAPLLMGKGVELSNHVLDSMGDAAEAEVITTDPCFTICSEKEQGHSSSTAEVIWEDERITRQICCH